MMMGTRYPAYKRYRSGATLIIVLAIVCLVTLLVVSFMGTVRFERNATQSYSGKLSAQQIAIGGLNRQLADFKQEIIAGSTADPGPNPNATSPVYYKPLASTCMVPASYTDVTSAFTNLIRTSASNSITYGQAYSPYTTAQVPENLAAPSSTLTPAPNGVYISAARWQASQLLVPGEKMPAPDWIIVTRSGPTNMAGFNGNYFGVTGNTLNNPSPLNTNYVVGRYAYVVYNEGGLVDATIAGAPAVASADEIGNRGSSAFASLTNNANILTAAQETELTGWRNPASAVTETSYTNYIYNVATTNGFLPVQPGDNTFLSRQDLIAYANHAGLTSALPYLGTFSRDVNAPAYIPPAATASPNFDPLSLRFANAGTVDAGGTLLVSRKVKAQDFLLTRRFPLGRLSWISYNGVNPNSGASAYDVWRAFGLVWDSLNNGWDYVSSSGTTPPLAGISSIQTSIETLDQVAAENPPRDPNFFELLQAAILKGSLGQTSGGQQTLRTGPGGEYINFYGASGDTSGFDSVPAYQIVKIGANILDQASPDSFPIAILFGPASGDEFVGLTGTYNDPNGTPTTAYQTFRTFCGVENLPYINRFVDSFVRFTNPPAGYPSTYAYTGNPPFLGSTAYKQPWVGCWEQMELWNPHQPVGLSTAVGLYPSGFRIIASGQVSGRVYSRSQAVGGVDYVAYTSPNFPPPATTASPLPQTTWTFPANTGNPSAVSTYMQLSSAAAQNFSEPKLVTTTDLSSSTNCSANFYQSGANTVNAASASPFVGLYVGCAYAPDWSYCAGMSSGGNYNGGSQNFPPITATSTSDPACVMYGYGIITPYDSANSSDPGVTYAMQYLDPAGTWHTYDYVKNQTSSANSNLPYSTTTACSWTIQASDNAGRFAVRMDPRTDRFSTSKSVSKEQGPVLNYPLTSASTDPTVRPDTGLTKFQSDSYFPQGPNWVNTPPSNPVSNPYFVLGSIMENRSAISSYIYYTDLDGVLRRADGAYDIISASQYPSGHPGIANATYGASGNLARPIILNRPFRSVGELGYASRDVPWKTLDFFTKDSGDAALLDFFSVSDADVVAGRIDLNTRNPQALAEVLSGAMVNPLHASDGNGFPLTSAQATTLATDFVTATKVQPLRSLAEMVTSALATATAPQVGSSLETILTDDTTAWQPASLNIESGSQNSKIQREAPIRALAEASSARTWNLLIDVIGQSGHYALTQNGNSLDTFIPDGEKRYWLHVAIDRYTGRIVDRYLEPVVE